MMTLLALITALYLGVQAPPPAERMLVPGPEAERLAQQSVPGMSS